MLPTPGGQLEGGFELAGAVACIRGSHSADALGFSGRRAPAGSWRVAQPEDWWRNSDGAA